MRGIYIYIYIIYRRYKTNGGRIFDRRVDIASQVTLFLKRHGVVRAEEEAETMYASIDLASSIIQRKLRKVKEKDSDHGRHMKGFNRSKVREPDTSIVTDDEEEEEIDETVPEQEQGVPEQAVEENFLGEVAFLFIYFIE